MRLVDKIINAAPMAAMTDRYGKIHQLTAVGGKADAIRACGLRYILDEHVSRECINLILEPKDELLAPDNELLRLPSCDFWVEWFGMASIGAAPKVGAFVQASEDGLGGSITGYWEDELGRATTTGVTIHFDLGERSSAHGPRPAGFGFRHGTHEHVNQVLERASLGVDPQWASYLKASSNSFGEALRAIANANWYFLPLTCAFAAMLNSPGLIRQRASQLERLNAARARRGRTALLDHVEVSLNLDRARAAVGQAGGEGGRNFPRLHHVRGHFVQRAGKTHWRSSHLRGDAGKAILTKTVLVKRGPRGEAIGGQDRPATVRHDRIDRRIAT